MRKATFVACACPLVSVFLLVGVSVFGQYAPAPQTRVSAANLTVGSSCAGVPNGTIITSLASGNIYSCVAGLVQLGGATGPTGPTGAQGVTGAAGTAVYCAPASASGTTYTCAPSPALAAYAAGTTLGFVPDVTGAAGAITVNVNALGAKAIKEADGATNPTVTDLAAGKAYALVYDGSVFRLQGQSLSSGLIVYGDTAVASLQLNSGAGSVLAYNMSSIAVGGSNINFTVLGSLQMKQNASGGISIGSGVTGTDAGEGNLLLEHGITAVTFTTSTNCSSAASPAVCGSASAGAVAVPTGVNPTIVVNTSAVTAVSEIGFWSDDSVTIAATTCNSTLATLIGGLAITARTPGVSFTLSYNGTITTNKLCVTYIIHN